MIEYYELKALDHRDQDVVEEHKDENEDVD